MGGGDIVGQMKPRPPPAASPQAGMEVMVMHDPAFVPFAGSAGFNFVPPARGTSAPEIREEYFLPLLVIELRSVLQLGTPLACM
jgi:hypothetical protein